MRVTAIVWMIVYHVIVLNHHPGFIATVLRIPGRMGWIGSEFFFVIAGYFCYLLVASRPQARVKHSAALVKRVFRIMVPYTVFLGLYLTVGLKLERMVGNNFVLSQGYLQSLFTFTTNFRLAIGPFSGVALEGFFSVAIGVQLFLLLTVIFKIVTLPSRRIAILLSLLFIAIVLRIIFHNRTPWFIYFFTFTRMDAFIIGALLGLLHTLDATKTFMMKNKGKVLFVGGLVFLVIFVVTKGLYIQLPLTHQLGYPGVSLAVASLMNYAINSESNRFFQGLGSMGKFSFSVYLVKLPLIWLVYSLLESLLVNPDGDTFIIVFLFSSLLLCFGFAYLWYNIIECPLGRLSAAFIFRKRKSP